MSQHLLVICKKCCNTVAAKDVIYDKKAYINLWEAFLCNDVICSECIKKEKSR